MECCLYCGEPITLLQRWKLGGAKVLFCSREHEDAHTELQAQAVMRLVMQAESIDTAEDEPAVPKAAAADLLLPDLAPAAMTARPQNSWRVAPIVSADPVTPRPARPPLGSPCASFSFANCIAVPVAPAQIARLDPARARNEALEFDPPAPLLAAGTFAPFTPTLGISDAVPLPGPVPKVAIQPRLSLDAEGCSSSFSLAGVDHVRTVTLTLKMAGAVECFEGIRSMDRRVPTVAPRERSLTEISVNMPVHDAAAPALSLSMAGLQEMRAPGSTPEPVGIGFSLQLLELSINLRFPGTPATGPRLQNGGHHPMDVKAIRSCADLAGLEVAPFDQALYPLYANNAGLPPAFPLFMLDPLIGEPIKAGSDDRVIHWPALLLLKRGTGRGNQFPAFKSVPMQILSGSSAPVFSIKPVRLSRPSSARAVAAAGRGLAW
jgi:hypothetical protein